MKEKCLGLSVCGGGCESCPANNNIITEQQLKDRCTSEIIKKMVELADGFIVNGYMLVEYQDEIYNFDSAISKDKIFPLLIHRAVEGWNKKYRADSIVCYGDRVELCIDFNLTEYMITDYQPQSLTQSESAMLHCMLDIFEEEKK